MQQGVWIVMLVISGATGCVRTETIPYEYRIPLEENSHGADAARSCAAACSSANHDSATGFYACLGTCPDVRVVSGAACTTEPEDTPPRAFCYTRNVEHDVLDTQTTGFVLALIGKVAEAGIQAAAHDDSGAHHTHHRRH